MRLSDFIEHNTTQILVAWEQFAGSLFPELDPRLLRDHAAELLTAIISDMKTEQSVIEQRLKSKGKGTVHALSETGKVHAVHRLETGFTLFQVVSEYRYLRAAILRLWEKEKEEDKAGITRFNESIDEALIEATQKYSSVTDMQRVELLAILGHDLRNPLGAIIMGATVLTSSETMSDKDSRIATRIMNSARRMHRMIDYLLDLARIKNEKKLPINTSLTDIEMVCRLVIAELGMIYPHRVITFQSEGDLHGRWDGDRLAQVISNLLANALQHSVGEVRISTYEEKDNTVVVEVHNDGPPINEALLGTIFNQMITENGALSSGLGLGLYIAREIVESHGGCILVTSSEANGTVFTMRIPRQVNSYLPLKAQSI